MCYAKITLVLVGFAATLCAADPFAGTWKMNSSKTKYNSGTAPKEQTITITESGSDLNVKVDGTAADGSKISLSYTMPSSGGTGKILESPAYDGISGERVGPNEREVRYMKGSKVVFTTHSMLSTDGDSLSVSLKGVNPLGESVDANTVYDRQK